MKISIVVTTVQTLTKPLLELSLMCKKLRIRLIIVLDAKSPENFSVPYGDVFSLSDQSNLGFQISKSLPKNSYSRKLIGYLIALRLNSDWILETDDDNFISTEFFQMPELTEKHFFEPKKSPTFINPYMWWNRADIWPRGFPLNHINLSYDRNFSFNKLENTSKINVGVVQSLAEGNPDVDAIYRLTKGNVIQEKFKTMEPLLIPRNSYSPFNSQATKFIRELALLMYLPTTCSFRLTDIWRSYVTQRFLHNTSYRLMYVNAQVHQKRNEHNLLMDFKDEIEGYLRTEELIEILDKYPLNFCEKPNSSDFYSIYESLVQQKFLKSEELENVENWIEDIEEYIEKH